MFHAKAITLIKKLKVYNQGLGVQGIGLVETIVAMGVAVIVITSMVSLSVFTLRASTRGKLYLRGSKLADQQIELMRAYRDTRVSWQQFLTDASGCGPGAPCNLSADPGNAYNLKLYQSYYYENQNTPLEVRVTVNAIDAQTGGAINVATTKIVRVTAQTRWKIGDQEKFNYVYTDLSDWRSQ